MIIHTVARLSFINVQQVFQSHNDEKRSFYFYEIVLLTKSILFEDITDEKKVTYTRYRSFLNFSSHTVSLQTPSLFRTGNRLKLFNLSINSHKNKTKPTNLSSDSLILRRIKNSTNLNLFVRNTQTMIVNGIIEE